MPVKTRSLHDTPVAVIDIETTGLSPEVDRIVEISVVRLDPGEPPRVVLDTLVDPQRRVTCSEIHGIYDDDVVGAPLFHELADPFAKAVDGAVVAAFNVYFDIRFIEAELSRAKIDIALPHLCLMWMRPALGLGKRATLTNTCAALGIKHKFKHRASSDALTGAQLWPKYLQSCNSQGINTFADIASLKSYKFIRSWDAAPIKYESLSLKPLGTALKPRITSYKPELKAVPSPELLSRLARSDYWDALTSALVDGDIDAQELSSLRDLRSSPNLTMDDVRYVHAKVFAGLLEDLSIDMKIDAAEVEWVGHVHRVMHELGWAPGDVAITPPPAMVAEPTPVVEPLAPARRSWWDRMFG